MFSVDNDQNPDDTLPCPAGAGQRCSADMTWVGPSSRSSTPCPPPALQLPVPAKTNIFVINQGKPMGWEVAPVLVMDPALWPAKDGSSGITSAREMDAAEQADKAIEVGSNFFLFFSSQIDGK